jgi:hypothetical protein
MEQEVIESGQRQDQGHRQRETVEERPGPGDDDGKGSPSSGLTAG